jgi:hypothetical protein
VILIVIVYNQGKFGWSNSGTPNQINGESKMKASEIERILSCKITKDDGTIIELTEDSHLSVLNGLMNILQSTIGNSDAEKSQEDVSEFISDVKIAKLNKFIFEVTDNVKTVVVSGETLRALVAVWSNATVQWHVTRGGKRAQTKAEVSKLGSL